ncbi:cd81 antigen [Characodon lateralis]|uniref:Cd81 antigen n=1 Tax=Characodon lateralis TaxID=208331 RepID=A0ABU7D615_9TELE|nr:cd81 antigen [Characodon lateralis]
MISRCEAEDGGEELHYNKKHCCHPAGNDCHGKIDELFSDKIYLVGIAALVVAVIMIFEMIFSMVLCCGIRNSPVY